MLYEFEVPGKIIGKGRPRLNSYTGSVYTPTKTKDYEELIQQYFLIKYPRYEALSSRVTVDITACFGIPKSTKKKDREEMIKNELHPLKKPDIDNVVKIVLDALNGVTFKDDIQVTKLNVEKRYSEEEKLIIKVYNY